MFADEAMKPGALLIRADASLALGTGHVMRCLALAQAWQDAGGYAIFAMAQSTPAIEERLRNEDAEAVRVDAVPGSDSDCQKLVALSRSRGPSWAMVDGYEFTANYLQELKREGLRLLLVDDNGRLGTYAVDAVLNPNLHARESLYQNREAYTRLLLGPRYALLRREFAPAKDRRETSPVARKLLVSLGGSDPENVTLRVLQAVEQVAIENLEVAVVVGGSNPRLATVTAAASKSRHRCRVLNNVANMREIIFWADFAISAAGGACWEYCALGLPAILLAVAENQAPNASCLHAARAALLLPGGTEFDLGQMAETITSLANSPAERQALSQTARALVDGKGARRTVSALWPEADL